MRYRYRKASDDSQLPFLNEATTVVSQGTAAFNDILALVQDHVIPFAESRPIVP